MSLAKRYIDALSRGDVAELKAIAAEVVNNNNLTIINLQTYIAQNLAFTVVGIYSLNQ
jgi:hypothetical protein